MVPAFDKQSLNSINTIWLVPQFARKYVQVLHVFWKTLECQLLEESSSCAKDTWQSWISISTLSSAVLAWDLSLSQCVLPYHYPEKQPLSVHARAQILYQRDHRQEVLY